MAMVEGGATVRHYRADHPIAQLIVRCRADQVRRRAIVRPALEDPFATRAVRGSAGTTRGTRCNEAETVRGDARALKLERSDSLRSRKLREAIHRNRLRPIVIETLASARAHVRDQQIFE
jgi:hypothetical protein